MTAFRFLKKGKIEYLESAALAGCDFLVHAFCTRHEGVSGGSFGSLNFSARTGDDSGKVSANWELLADAFAIAPDRFRTVHQVHGDAIHAVNGSVDIPRSAAFPPEGELSCDAMITDRPGIALGIKTADCVPIFLVDRVKPAIGAVHAGWRGTAAAILKKTVEAILERYAGEAKDVVVAIGPAIGGCSYEVGREVIDGVKRATGEGGYYSTKGDKYYLDLPAANKQQILSLGVPPENIWVSPDCTFCAPDRFYSYRFSKGSAGRQGGFIGLL